jgi:hypothetical protein
MPTQSDQENPPKSGERNFPRVTLEDAIRVPTAIKEKNAGNAWDPSDVAKAVGIGAKTGKFFYLTAGSRDYGLTVGTKASKKIELTELGKALVYPDSPQTASAAKLRAFIHVELFKRILLHYKGNNLPEMEYLSNTLKKEFNLDTEYHDELVDLFGKNCRFVGIGTTLPAELGGAGAPISSVSTFAPSASVTLAKPDKTGGKVAFVVMPFTEREERHPQGFFQEVIKSLIVPAGKAAGFEIRSANRHGSDVIQSTIINELLKADLVIADLTEHNPNVLFELGMRMAEDRPVALIRAKGTGRIFDVDNMLRVYDYDPCLWPSTVEKDLPFMTEHIKATWDNRESDVTYLKLLRREPTISAEVIA